ncbi:MAG: DUF6125 family protein [Candidatus Thermoplasmatota archaeon]|nr:DUF6125 family protein [Candidatus Thermoplasmatota archaeon]
MTENIKDLDKLTEGELKKLLLETVRSLWSVDGLYFLGIEKRFGTEKATDIDAEVWSIMGVIEAKRLKKFFNITGNGIKDLYRALSHSSWYLYMDEKDMNIVDNRYVEIKNYSCTIQKTRIKKGLNVFPCERVREGFLRSFAKEINSDFTVKVVACPPSGYSDDLWCSWQIMENKTDGDNISEK